MSISKNVLSAIGNTSIVQLQKVVPFNCAKIFAKLEWENPTGSMKDRTAQAMIARAEEDGRLKPGDTIVEYTGGSTGISLALICVAKGYRLHIVSSEAFSQEKLRQMAAFGAELTLVPSEGGLTTKKLILDMIEAAREISKKPHSFWTNQLSNADSITGYFALAEEIWSQTDGKLDAFVQSVGTAASLRGVATVLKQHDSMIKIIAVEPAESAVLSGGQPGPHKIEGVGIGYIPPLWDPSLVDEIVAVKTEDAKAMARRLARDEGLFAGTSSGANVIAAIKVGERLGPNASIVTLMVDSGLKYLEYRRLRQKELAALTDAFACSRFTSQLLTENRHHSADRYEVHVSEAGLGLVDCVSSVLGTNREYLQKRIFRTYTKSHTTPRLVDRPTALIRALRRHRRTPEDNSGSCKSRETIPYRKSPDGHDFDAAQLGLEIIPEYCLLCLGFAQVGISDFKPQVGHQLASSQNTPARFGTGEVIGLKAEMPFVNC